MRMPRFRIVHLLLLTGIVAAFCVVLVNENEWLRATYVTGSLAVLLNAVIAAIFARGRRQAFAGGFVVGSFLFGLSCYAAPVTLPYLLTARLYDWMQATSVAPDDDHYWIVMATTWAMLMATSSGVVARGWHLHVQAGRGGEDACGPS
jgi:hypothetical protein